jgi:AraC-like DNA-binding protein
MTGMRSAVRRYHATLPEAQTGWLAGLRDAKIGKALAVLHTRPAHTRTTDELAQAVGMSRSAFAERFTSLVGMPPMRYLTRCRLQLAAVRLRESPRSLGKIAYDVDTNRKPRSAGLSRAPSVPHRETGVSARTDPATKTREARKGSVRAQSCLSSVRPAGHTPGHVDQVEPADTSNGHQPEMDP